MAWPGGKDGAGVAQRLINEIPPHEVFVSPFLGDCAILRRKRPARVSVGIDLDRANIERWSTAARVPGLRLYCCCGIEWLRHAFHLYAFAGDVDGFGGEGLGLVPPLNRAALAIGTGPQKAAAAAVAAECGESRSTGDGSSGAGSWFVYADPPYLFDSRRSKRPIYAHEMTDQQHAELLATLVRLPCLVMVSHYPHPLYAKALAGWRTFTYKAQTRGGGKATEQVWCNYPPPAELHDARYLGRNKREREKIRRRVRNWSAGLARMPALERQAILDALQAR